jgi:hypothetical protein
MPNNLGIEDLADLFTSTVDGKYQRKPKVIAGILGDGTSEKRVEVPGSKIHVYFRPRLAEEIWEVRHLVGGVPRVHAWPVRCVYNERVRQWDVLEIDEDAFPGYYEGFDFHRLTDHAKQHIINEEEVGFDAVWLYRRAIVNLRAQPPDDGSFRIYVQSGELPFRKNQFWPGGYCPDLLPHIPSTDGEERWVTVYFKTDGTLSVIGGVIHSPGLRFEVDPPYPLPGTVPICYVALPYGIVEITEAEIWDGRRIIGPMDDDRAEKDLMAYMYMMAEVEIKRAEGEM